GVVVPLAVAEAAVVGRGLYHRLGGVVPPPGGGAVAPGLIKVSQTDFGPGEAGPGRPHPPRQFAERGARRPRGAPAGSLACALPPEKLGDQALATLGDIGEVFRQLLGIRTRILRWRPGGLAAAHLAAARICHREDHPCRLPLAPDWLRRPAPPAVRRLVGSNV